MPKQYVEVEAAKEFAATYLNDIFFRSAVCQTLDAAPKADVAPVRRGRWVEDTNNAISDIKYFMCSSCGYVISSRYGVNRFCPNCGADLIGDNDG